MLQRSAQKFGRSFSCRGKPSERLAKIAEAYSKPSQQLTTFTKNTILYVLLGSEYAFECSKQTLFQIYLKILTETHF